jgi:hypothetical protein
MKNFELSAADFRTIHNALCDLRSVQNSLEPVVREDLLIRLNRVVDRMEEGLAQVRAQESDQFDRKISYYHQFQEANGLRAIWSLFDLPEHGFLQDHPYESARLLKYQGQQIEILGQTWGDLYRAADDVIQRSGDGHHIFIEGFHRSADRSVLRLTTGS